MGGNLRPHLEGGNNLSDIQEHFLKGTSKVAPKSVGGVSSGQALKH